MLNFKRISVFLEGGAGDHICATRFIPAIKEIHPNSEITAFTNTDGKTFQKELLEILFPSFYKEIKVIPHKKYKKYIINSQFGEEEYKGDYNNVPDEWRQEMESYDKFYNLHIDYLGWLKEDFDWLRYYRFFPRPDFQPEKSKEDYVVFHMVSSSSNDHRLDQFYINRLIKDTSKFIKVKIISTPEINYFYKDFINYPNVEILNVSLKEVCATIHSAKCMFCTDSGFKYVGFSYGIPTISTSKQISAPGQPFPSHQIRWNMFPETCFPLNYDCVYISNLIKRICENKAYILVPQLTDFENQAIHRIFTLNKEKSILN